MDDIKFTGIVYKVQTLVDGGARVAFDLPNSEILAATQLMAVAGVTGITVEVEVRVKRTEESDHLQDW